jgi:hypothetical protein
MLTAEKIDAVILDFLRNEDDKVRAVLTREVGPYDITEPRPFTHDFARAIERAVLESSQPVGPQASDLTDAARYRHLRNLAIERTGIAGQPCIAMPNGMNSGYYLTEETADHAIDTAMRCLSCGGSGWLGGPSFYEPGEGGEPCPDCSPKAAMQERVMLGLDSDECDAQYRQYLRNLNGAPATAREAFRAAWHKTKPGYLTVASQPVGPVGQEDERAKFEKFWSARHPGANFIRDASDPEEYADASICFAWIGYRARAAQPVAGSEPMEVLAQRLDIALDALDEIALAGMGLPMEAMNDDAAADRFHARQAWNFIRIAARAKEASRAALPIIRAELASPADPDWGNRTALDLNGEPIVAASPVAQPIDADERTKLAELIAGFRLSNWVDDMGDGSLLVDRITSGGDIGPGKAQIELLADEIADFYAARASQPVAVSEPMEVLRELVAAEDEHFSLRSSAAASDIRIVRAAERVRQAKSSARAIIARDSASGVAATSEGAE